MKYIQTFEKFNTKVINNNDGILVIVDVQEEFDDFIPQGYVTKLNEYCRTFEKVYQIWDTTKATKPSYKFPNQVSTTDKRFGSKWFDGDLKAYVETFSTKNNLKIGQLFQVSDKENEYIVFTNNNHKWFYINENLTKLFRKLEGKKVVLVGGAGSSKTVPMGECITDVYIAMKAFGVKPIYNPEFIYSASTNDGQKVNPEIVTQKNSQ